MRTPRAVPVPPPVPPAAPRPAAPRPHPHLRLLPPVASALPCFAVSVLHAGGEARWVIEAPTPAQARTLAERRCAREGKRGAFVYVKPLQAPPPGRRFW